jgi:hypothetical protein
MITSIDKQMNGQAKAKAKSKSKSMELPPTDPSQSLAAHLLSPNRSTPLL